MSNESIPLCRRITVEVVGGDVAVVNFKDSKIFDESNIQDMGYELFTLVDKLGCNKIILNFGNVEYLSSAALGKFITLNKKTEQASGKLVMCCINPEIYETFEMTKLNRLFRIVNKEQEALTKFN